MVVNFHIILIILRRKYKKQYPKLSQEMLLKRETILKVKRSLVREILIMLRKRKFKEIKFGPAAKEKKAAILKMT